MAVDEKVSTKFNDLFVELSKHIGKESLMSLKRYCNPKIPEIRMEKHKTAYDVFKDLYDQGFITYTNTTYLEEILKTIGKARLISKVNAFLYAPRFTVEDCSTEDASSSQNPAEKEVEFGLMLLNIAEDIREDEFKSLKRHCDVLKFIPKGRLEKMKTASDVFESLREQTIISVDNTEKLEGLLKNINRNDLVNDFVVPFKSKH